MPPMYGIPNYDFQESQEGWGKEGELDNTPGAGFTGLSEMAFWYMIVLIGMLLIWLFIFFCLRLISLRQKTRAPPARRMYAGSRQRPSLTTQEPTIYVSPSNLPPPPKYECMAPPSYEEVVGIHYPNYQIQPITQPINAALAQTSTHYTPPTTTPDNVVASTVNETTSPPPAPRTAPTDARPAAVTVIR